MPLWLLGHGEPSLSDEGESDDEDEEDPEPAEPVTEHIHDVHLETEVPIDALQSLDAQGLLRQIPRDADGKITSVGSIMHGREKCTKPCLFHPRKCCSKGLFCLFCHLPHQIKKKLPLKSPATARTPQEHDQKSKDIPLGAMHIRVQTSL